MYGCIKFNCYLPIFVVVACEVSDPPGASSRAGDIGSVGFFSGSASTTRVRTTELQY
jgi:hypothetical protein